MVTQNYPSGFIGQTQASIPITEVNEVKEEVSSNSRIGERVEYRTNAEKQRLRKELAKEGLDIDKKYDKVVPKGYYYTNTGQLRKSQPKYSAELVQTSKGPEIITYGKVPSALIGRRVSQLSQPQEQTARDVTYTDKGEGVSKAYGLQTQTEKERTAKISSQMVSTSEGVKYYGGKNGSVYSRSDNRTNPYGSIASVDSQKDVSKVIQEKPKSELRTAEESFGKQTIYSKLVRKQEEAKELARLNPEQAGAYNVRGYFYGAVSVPILIFTQPKEFVLGIVSSVTHPRQALLSIGESLRTEPEFFIGQQVATYGTFKGISAGSRIVSPVVKPYLVGDATAYVRGTEQFIKYGYESKIKQFESPKGNEFTLRSKGDLGQTSLKSGTVTRTLGASEYKLTQPQYNEFVVQGTQSRLNEFVTRQLQEFPKPTGTDFRTTETRTGQLTLGGKRALDSFKEPEPYVVKDLEASTQYKQVPIKVYDINLKGEVKVSNEIKLKPLEEGSFSEPTSVKSTKYFTEKPTSSTPDTLFEGAGGSEKFSGLDFSGSKRSFRKQLESYNQDLVLIEQEVSRGKVLDLAESVTTRETVRVPIQKEVSISEPLLSTKIESPMINSNIKTALGEISVLKQSDIQSQPQIPSIRESVAQSDSQRIKIVPIQIQSQPQQIKLTPLQIQQQTPQLKQEQVIQQQVKQIQEQRPSQRRVNEEIIKPLEYTMPTFTLSKTKKKSSKSKLFVKRKGKFELKGESEDLGMLFKRGKDIIENTASASFKVVSESGKAILPNILGSKFTKSKRNEGVIVQKREFRIGTAGEKFEITRKGIEANRRRLI